MRAVFGYRLRGGRRFWLYSFAGWMVQRQVPGPSKDADVSPRAGQSRPVRQQELLSAHLVSQASGGQMATVRRPGGGRDARSELAKGLLLRVAADVCRPAQLGPAICRPVGFVDEILEDGSGIGIPPSGSRRRLSHQCPRRELDYRFPKPAR